MPKIPTFDQPTVAPQKAPGVMMPSAPASGGQAVGSGLANLGMSLGQVALDQQHQANVTRVEDANNQLRSKQLDIIKFVQQQRGKNAFDPKAFGGQEGQSLEEVAAGMFDGEASGLDQDLANDAQRQMFRQARDRFRLDLQGQVQAHTAQQTKVVQDDEFKGTLAVEQQNVGLNGYANGKLDMPTIQQSEARSIAAVERYAQQNGWSDDQLQAAKRDTYARIHGTVIDRMLESHNIDGAKVYFQMHEKDMSPEAVTGIRRSIEGMSTAIDVQRNVDRVLSMGKDLESSMDELRKTYEGNPIALKEAYTEFEQRYRIKKQSQAIAKQENEGKLWDMRFPTLPGQKAVSMADIQLTPEWKALDGEQRNDLRMKWERYAKRNENDPDLQFNRFTHYWAYASQPEKLKDMSDAQIFALKGDIGPQGVQDLLQLRNKLVSDPGKVIASNVDTNQLKVWAREAGMKVDGVKPDSPEAAALGDLKYRVDMDIEHDQQAKGRMLTRDERDTIIKRSLTKFTLEGGARSWFNPARWFGGSVDPEFVRYGFQLKGGDKIEVPADQKDVIIKEFQDHGIPSPTEDQIRDRYFFKQQAAIASPKPNLIQRPVAPPAMRVK